MEMIFERFHVFRVINTKKGYKFMNVEMFRTKRYGDETKRRNECDLVEINPEKLFLCVDYLKDKYTLLNCNIMNSPHFGLMEVLSEGGDIRNTEYIKRYKNGTIDARYPQLIKRYDFFYTKFKEMSEKMDSNSIEPISVFKIRDFYYIRDGKHRAALCAYYKKPIIGHIEDLRGLCGTVGNVVKSLMLPDQDYSKHNDFFRELQNH